MKTLDEVIATMEYEAQYNCGEQRSYDADAIHYLKEFQSLSKMWNDKLDKEQDNPPLTWDELKQMDGKPVWVEDYIDEPEDTTKYWAIYRRIDKAQETEYALLSEYFYDKAEYGKTWQAYRKEHE